MTRECLVEHRRSGIGLVLISPEKIIIKKSLRLAFLATNIEMGVKAVEVFSDSRLVVGQVKRELEARDVRMKRDLSQVKHL